MILHLNFVLKSYVKTTIASLLLVFLALLLAILGEFLLPRILGIVIIDLGLLIAASAAILVCASLVVLARYKRDSLGKRDLFLELNRSREPEAIRTSTIPRATRWRRWLATRLLGHDFLVGDLVEVKTWAEIRATLDERGCLDQLPFMSEMFAMCGRRAHVFRCVHRLFDYRKTRRMRHMNGAVLLVQTVCDGSSHGGCEASCHTIWKADWLRRVADGDAIANTDGASIVTPAPPGRGESSQGTAILLFGTKAPRYTCQLTQLHAASQPIGNWSALNFLRPLISGNVTPAAFVVGWLTNLFNKLQHMRQGVGFPAFETTSAGAAEHEEIQLEAGDPVTVRSSGEIRATLNDQYIHRGMGFEEDMLKYCGHRHYVQAEIRGLIDIVTGEMRTMKTPAYLLRDVHFSGERQFFNAQHEPLFWRAVWLRRDRD